MLTKFDYLLNAFEAASQHPEPASQDYAAKRAALFAHVRELEAYGEQMGARSGRTVSQKEITVHCPKCGGTDIREVNDAVAFLPVTAWEFDDETGEPSPTDYDTDVEADWETSDSPHPYQCFSDPATCSWEGTLDALRVEDAPVSESRA